jgi:hypothetical protein
MAAPGLEEEEEEVVVAVVVAVGERAMRESSPSVTGYTARRRHWRQLLTRSVRRGQ